MARLIPTLILFFSGALFGARLPEWYARSLPDAEFQARLVREASEIEAIAGDSFEGDVVLVEIKVRPLYGARLELRREDFLLRARNNNDTSPAQTPDRIAGSAVLELGKERSTSSGGLFADNPNSGVWGGAPGTGTRPQRIPGPPDLGGGAIQQEERRTVDQRSQGGNSVVDRLHDIELPLEAAEEPVSGYLYFEIGSKTKRKHLELSYDGSLGEFLVEFKRPE